LGAKGDGLASDLTVEAELSRILGETGLKIKFV